MIEQEFRYIGTVVNGHFGSKTEIDNSNIMWLIKFFLKYTNPQTFTANFRALDYDIVIEHLPQKITDHVKVHLNDILIIEFIIEYLTYSHATSRIVKERVHNEKLSKEFKFFVKLSA